MIERKVPGEIVPTCVVASVGELSLASMLEKKTAQNATSPWASAGEREYESDGQLLSRFSASNDQGAFEELVRRHGGMVMGVCRRVLSCSHDAEEAFQATFIVLARKSDSLRKPELLANWLYGVAFRAALKMRDRTAKRRRLERKTSSYGAVDSSSEVEQRELHLVLDEEIRRLPQKLRAPLVLCYLEGKSNREAARQLGWPLGSMSWHLGQARKRLRARLLRRGVVLSGGALAAALCHESSTAAVSATLVDVAVKSAIASAGGPAVGGAGSASADTLAEKLLQGLYLTRVAQASTVATALLAATTTLTGTAIALIGKGDASDGVRAASRSAHVQSPASPTLVDLNRSVDYNPISPPPDRLTQPNKRARQWPIRGESRGFSSSE